MTTTYQINIVVQGQDRASGPLGSVQRALGGLGSIAGGILAAGTLLAIANGIMNLGREALDSYANYERLGMALQSLVAREMVSTGQSANLAAAMGAASKKAGELQGWVTKLAIQSPFKEEDIATSLRLGLSYSFQTAEAQRLTMAIGDYAAGAGLSGEAMKSVALALGQIKAKGKLAGQEVMQLTNAGLPVRDILAKAFGVTTAELEEMQSKGLIPANKAIQAIVESLEKDFGGSMKAQAGTFSGLLTSLSEIKDVGLRTYFEGTFKSIQPYLTNFVDKFSDPAFMANLGAMGERLGKFVSVGINGLIALGMSIDSFSKSAAAKSATDNIKKIFSVLAQPKIAKAVRQVFGGIKGFLDKLSAKALPFAVDMFEKLGGWFTENGPLIAATVQKLADNFDKYFLPALMLVWNVAAPILKGLLDVILGVVKMVMQIFTGDWAGAWDTFVQILNDAGRAVWDSMWALFAGIATIMGTSLEEIGKTWSANWEQFKRILSEIWLQISTTWSANWEQFKQILNKVMTQIGTTWSANWEQFKKILSSVWEIITAYIYAKVTEIYNSITTWIDEIIGFISGSYDDFLAAGYSIVNGLKKAFDDSYSAFLDAGYNIVAGIEQGIKDAWVALINTFDGLIAMLPEAVKKILGIASPSKVMAWIGKQIMLGLANGITANSLLPQVALNAAIGNFSGGQFARGTSNYTSTSRDDSYKQYAPAYVSLNANGQSLEQILKGLRTR
ncbi:MAG: tape measure protein [Anaerolineales bacterium]|nr:tape measure protein [Anaerolineales bacterium]